MPDDILASQHRGKNGKMGVNTDNNNNILVLPRREMKCSHICCSENMSNQDWNGMGRESFPFHSKPCHVLQMPFQTFLYRATK